MKLLGISGSLRAQSNNTRLLQAAALCVPEGISFQLAECLGGFTSFQSRSECNGSRASVGVD